MRNERERREAQARQWVLAAAMVLWTVGWAGAAGASDGAGTGPFRQGSVRMSLLFGGGRAFSQDYRVYGAGVGYYVLDGLEVGLDAETWKGKDPGITRLSPQIMYVLPTGREARPYAGAFYRRSFINGYRDLNDAGGRGGLLFLLGRSAYLGAGLVYERHLGCDRTVYDSCSEAYPELLVAVIF